MKKTFAVLLTVFISTGAMLAGLNQHRILLGYGMAVLVWLISYRCLWKHK